MILIKFFLMIILMFFVLGFGLSLWLWIKLRMCFLRSSARKDGKPNPPPGRGDIIEGDYQILDDNDKK